MPTPVIDAIKTQGAEPDIFRIILYLSTYTEKSHESEQLLRSLVSQLFMLK